MADAERPETLERELEETRERLAETIDELIDRTNPKNVVRREVNGVRAFFVDDRGEPRTENILKVAGGVAGFLVLLALIRRVTR